MVEAVEEVTRALWKGAKYVPDIIVELEDRGIRMSEKHVLDTAKALGLKGSDVYSRVYNNPGIIDKWWAEFELREEASALRLMSAKSIKNKRGVGRSRFYAGCTIADELNEKETLAKHIEKELLGRGFEEKEIQRIRKEVKY